MIITEQNKNNNAFDETRSFAVSDNNIPRNPQRQRPTGNTTPVRRPADLADTAANRAPQRAAQPSNGSNIANPPRRSASQQGQAKRPANTEAVRRPDPRANVGQAANAANAGQVPVRRNPSPQNRPANIPTGNRGPGQTNQRNVPTDRSAQLPTANPRQRSASNPAARSTGNSQPRAAVNPRAAQLRSPADHGPAAANAQSTKPIPTDMRQQMMRTRNTSLVDAKGNRRTDDDGKVKGGSGEGGNTVISLIKAVVYIVFVCVISVFLAVTIIFVANDVFAFVKSDEVVEIVLPENTTLDDLADILHENGVIEYPAVFKIYAVVKDDDQKYIAGTYSVNPMMNYSYLLAEFKEKIDYGTVRITIPEGYTTDEIIDLFVSQGIGTREGFIDVIQNGDFDYWFIEELELNGMSEDRIYRLDGYLFPDTYEFYKNSSEKTVINKLLRRFSQLFTKDYRNQCAILGYTVDEIVTLASIIEKEAANSSEFFKVSSVFHNRLNNPWNFPMLESDATVVYAIHHETGERNVDLNYESPYNTYMYDGLTPGPIANPSASALLAALRPDETNYYFFYAYNGTTYFSETKAQHEAYIEQFKNQAANQNMVDVPNT